jgi:ABC-type transport system involved in multi-copper enzyme maturation permease subunit
MSAPVEASLVEPARPAAEPAHGLSAVDRLLRWGGDRLNPILVKETRQAMKSKQFVITFALLLVFSWGWTILGVAIAGPIIRFSAQGPDLFAVYYVFLALPLLVIVPFGAFRSLAVEQEDRTYDLLAITTLNPRQIVAGKLGSAGLQMLVYLSAVTPCLAFTYLLRGIDFPTILFVIAYTVLISLGFAMVALLAGTLTSERVWQVVLSVILVGGLLLALWGVCDLTMELLWDTGQVPFDEPEFWQVCGGLLTAYVTTFALIFYAAAARITFPADNRSTRLRIVMLLQHVLFIGWMAWVWIGPAEGFSEIFYVLLSLMALYWYAMGALMTGESPELSMRVRRALPQSFLGRMFLTWFNPGPATGYVFAAATLGSGVMVVMAGVLVALIFSPTRLANFRESTATQIAAFGALALSYVVIYLGLGLLLVRLFRRFVQVGVLLAGLLNVLILVLAIFVPLVIHLLIPDLRGEDWTLLQTPNPFWTLVYLIDRSSLPTEAPVLLVVVPAAALVVFGLNVPGVVREVRRVRIEKPRRVAEEDAAAAAARRPPGPRQISPWDVEPA